MKKKISAWFAARKAPFLMVCDEINQMFIEGIEELNDYLGVRTFQIVRGLVLAAIFFGFIVLIPAMF